MLKREQTVLAHSKDLTVTFHSVKLSCYIHIFEAMRNVPAPYPFNLRKRIGAGSYSIFWKLGNVFSCLNVDFGLHPQNSLAISVLNFQLHCSSAVFRALHWPLILVLPKTKNEIHRNHTAGTEATSAGQGDEWGFGHAAETPRETPNSTQLSTPSTRVRNLTLRRSPSTCSRCHTGVAWTTKTCHQAFCRPWPDLEL